ncbi:hypothetical protein F8568_031870 [Actinomadura sp. LD22]|uniref:Uncharacterized protein n=1 Tax=Actinomadura physcomitrii TaxID=2650748 RepID=A0A6I4MLN7_9ACTN|nr:hypothetical protein [Actinomadura physcomitrii]MWA04887.1 hypothetical protein [Actinomadura physcomitrii]
MTSETTGPRHFAELGTPAGGFAGRALASGRTIDPGQWTSDGAILGLVREAGYLWGTVRDVETGDIVSLMRRVPPPDSSAAEGADTKKALSGKLIIMSTHDGAGALRIRREPKDAVDSRRVLRDCVPGGVRFRSAGGAPGRSFDLSLSPERLAYAEEGTVALHGALACPALQWFLPGADAALLYLTQTWEVSGTVLGRDVRGFLFWEEAYMYPRARLYVSKDPLHDVRYTTWYSWANRYADGTTEVGHFLFGQDDFHVGVVACSDGRVQVAKRMDATVSRNSEGYWHDGLDYTLDGEAWICEPDPRGRMELGPIPNPQQEGRIRRRDEKRDIDAWMAWGETVPGNGDSRRSDR